MSTVICFSGGIASGKTTLASAVAKHRGLRLATFGGFVRQVANRRKIPEEREALQELGAALIAEMTFDGFCSAVLRDAGWTSGGSVVVDGIRHVPAYEAIERLVSPVETRLFFVDVAREVRQSRADNPDRAERTELTKADAHSTEIDVHGPLRTLADRVLDGTKTLEELVEDVEAVLAGLEQPP